MIVLRSFFLAASAIAAVLCTLPQADAATIFQETFNYSDRPRVPGWTEFERDNGARRSFVRIRGNKMELLGNGGQPNFQTDAAAAIAIDATGFENLTLSFEWTSTVNNESGDNLYAAFAILPSLDASLPTLNDPPSWTVLGSPQSANGRTRRDVTVNLPRSVKDVAIAILFRSDVSGGSDGYTEGFLVDRVILTGDALPAADPVPLPGAAPLMLAGLGLVGWRRLLKRLR